MHKTNSLVHYKIFESYNNLLAFTTTKQSISDSNARFTGNEPTTYIGNRKNLAAILNIKEEQLLFPRQTHRNCVAVIPDFPKREYNETDALVTNKKQICLCIQTADCVPVLFFDPQQKVIAAVHAGWRGTVKKIAAVAIEKMIENYSCLPRNILAAIGPSIGPDVYEIGEEVVSAIEKNAPVLKSSVVKTTSGKLHFNLWDANRTILSDYGIPNENIEISGDCSFSNAEKYFSARREGVKTGRMVSGIMLKE